MKLSTDTVLTIKIQTFFKRLTEKKTHFLNYTPINLKRNNKI